MILSNKIKHIAIFDGSLTTTVFIRRLIKGLIKTGIQVSVLGFNEQLKNKVEGVNYIKLGSNQHVFSLITTCIKINPFSFQTYRDLFFGNRKSLQKRNLQLELQRLQPDIVHVQWPSLLPWMDDTFQYSHTPVILSERGSQVLVKSKVATEFRKKITPYYHQLSAIHAVSHNISTTSKNLFYHRLNTHVIYSGLNINEWSFTLKGKRRKNQPICFLSVGRAHYIKGYSYALQTLRLLKKKGGKFTYTIIGGKDEELNYLIHHYQLTSEVNIFDRLPISEVKKLYHQSDALLLPSLSEGVANVAIEAMAVGLPVISAQVGGMNELIKDGESGFLFEGRNSMDMLKAIENYINCDSLVLNQIIRNARHTVEKDFNDKDMISRWVKFYNGVLKQPV